MMRLIKMNLHARKIIKKTYKLLYKKLKTSQDSLGSGQLLNFHKLAIGLGLSLIFISSSQGLHLLRIIIVSLSLSIHWKMFLFLVLTILQTSGKSGSLGLAGQLMGA